MTAVAEKSGAVLLTRTDMVFGIWGGACAPRHHILGLSAKSSISEQSCPFFGLLGFGRVVNPPLPSATGLLFHKEGRHATWLELFFDLVFVAAISVVTHNLLGVHGGHLDHGHAWLYPLEIIPVWWIWASQTLFDNRFDTDGRGNRLVSLVIMLLVATMATLLGGGWADQTGLFISFYIATRLLLAFQYRWVSNHVAVCTRFARRMGLAVILGTALSSLSYFLDSPFREIAFQAGIFLEMICVAIWSKDKDAPPVHKEHLVERAGLLSISCSANP